MEKKNQRNIITASRNLSFPLSNRLAAFLLMAADHGIVREKHVSTAEYLGVSYRHLLYVLADFSKRGYIKKENGGYRITGREALLRLAKEMDPEWNFRSYRVFLLLLNSGLSCAESHAPAAISPRARKYVFFGISRNMIRENAAAINGATA